MGRQEGTVGTVMVYVRTVILLRRINGMEGSVSFAVCIALVGQ